MDGEAVLRETAHLIARGWCRGAEARNGYGQSVPASDPGARSWSLLGALVRVSERRDATRAALRAALWGISGVIPDSSLDDWNDRDGRTQGETLRMLASAGTSLAEQPPPSAWPDC